MKKIYLFCALWSLLSSASVCAQSTSWSAPDSAAVVTKPGSGPNPGWTISNPLMHNGSAFITGPMSQGFMDNTSDYLYFYDFGLNIPSNATVTGVELILDRGGVMVGIM